MQVLPEFLLDKLDRFPNRTAVIALRHGRWIEHSWGQFGADIFRFARLLDDAGIVPGDRIALIAENRYEWPVVDLAMQICGAISVPLSHQLTGPQTHELICHAEPVLVIVSDDVQAKKLAAYCPNDTRAIPVWVMDDAEWFSTEPVAPRSDHTLREEIDWMKKHCMQRTGPESTVTILYTSGTTGNPKGVMLSQSNLVSNAQAKLATLPLTGQDVRLCWLPMVHVFARLADLATAWINGCVSVISAGKQELFGEIQRFRPTYINGVPWLYEKCCRLLEARQELETPGALRQLLGGRPSICNCGGAPLPIHVLKVFAAQDVVLVNGYGLTETSPVLTSNSPTHNRPGSVGRPVPGVEIRISSDGAVQARGPNIMQGYFRDPQATVAAISNDWLDTGDLGHLDEDGYLWLTGRKKEMIVTLTGRKIAPSAIEQRLLADPWIAQSMVVGNNRRFLTALIVPASDGPGTAGKPDHDREIDTADRSLQESLMSRIRRAQSGLPRYEKIAGIVIVDQPFSVENGMATTKLSLKRYRIEQHYSARLEALYVALDRESEKSQQDT